MDAVTQLMITIASLNPLFAIASIALGLFGWLIPRYTMETLNMGSHTDTMAMSEVRASAGALFVGMGIGALLIGSHTAYLMLGACWMGAAIGRLTSIILDGTSRKKWGFLWVEAAVGIPAIAINWFLL